MSESNKAPKDGSYKVGYRRPPKNAQFKPPTVNSASCGALGRLCIYNANRSSFSRTCA